MDRKDFLARVKGSVATADLPDSPSDAPGAFVGDLGIEDMLGHFVARATEANADVSVIGSATALDKVAQIMRSYEADQFLAWADSHMPIPGIGAGLIAKGFSPRPSEVSSSNRIAHQSAYFDLAVGITGAEAGLAESGTIVLTHGPGRPRMASAIPLAHVALLPASGIVDSLSHWAASQSVAAAAVANLVMITGPSRTGDIEMHLTLGVHGPKHLHILVLEDR